MRFAWAQTFLHGHGVGFDVQLFRVFVRERAPSSPTGKVEFTLCPQLGTLEISLLKCLYFRGPKEIRERLPQ
jgi:hypothetical protein